SAKKVEFLKALLPGLSRLAIFAQVDNASAVQELKEFLPAATVLGLQVLQVEVRAGRDVVSAFEAAIGWHADAVLLTGNSVWEGRAAAGINKIALQSGLPVMCPQRLYVEAGCLMTYQAAAEFQWQRAAYFVDKILRGSKPGELPVEQPSQFQFVVNLRTAEA